MYDNNPFRIVKKLAEDNHNATLAKAKSAMDNLNKVSNPTGAPIEQGNAVSASINADSNRETMRKSIEKKRKYDEAQVRSGELPQSEFNRREVQGEYDLPRKMDEDINIETHPEDVSEGSESEFDDFDTQIQPEELPGADIDAAKEEVEKHNATIKDKLMLFLNKKPNEPLTKQVHSEIHRAKIYSNPHEQDSSVVRVAGKTFVVPHGHAPHIKLVS